MSVEKNLSPKNVADRSKKSRPKATPSRIQQNMASAKAIVDQKIVDNFIVHIAETEELKVTDLPATQVSVPLNLWLEEIDAIKSREGLIAVQIGVDEHPEDIAETLSDIDIIVLPFVNHVDGQAYSHAYKLRTRLGFKGQIRAIGDVKFDQLGFLTRVGCNAFELPDTEDLQTALRAFGEFSEVYQPSADGAKNIFSRRRAIH
ncbi:MAG: DUF934 domain-containing protein [Gammaproteobacteria bacterium]|nr:DUF934 domain-containing protein [Gammaproteobacteria bacterium]